METALDLVERLPVAALLGLAVGAPLVALLLAALIGGTPAVWLLVLGVLATAVAGGLLALRVHLDRMPLQLAPSAVRFRLDGHPAYAFRARLGRGRPMRRARASVRFLPDGGEPVDLEPLLSEGAGLVGPWSLVVVDREGRCDGPGRFEVGVQAVEDGRTWSASGVFPAHDIHPGRFEAAITVRQGRLAWLRDRWDRVLPGSLTGPEAMAEALPEDLEAG